MRNSQELWRPGKTPCGFVELLISGCKVLCHADGPNDALVLCHARRKKVHAVGSRRPRSNGALHVE